MPMENAPARKPHVLIVGAGFGGLEAAKLLSDERVRMTVIDRTNHHLFQPLLYQIATAALSPADIAAPIRGILGRCRNTEVILAEVKSVNVEARTVSTGEREIGYDYLILATGSRHSYFGHDEWEKLAPGLKSLEDAIEIRRRLLMAFEYAEKISDEAAKKAAMTFVVIGGGPTGVEMAGAIAEIARYTLDKDFKHIDPSSARVVLVEGDKRVLSSFPEDLSAKALEQLKELGVEVHTGIHAKDLTEEGLQVGEEFIPCRVKIWAAGNTASFVGKTTGAPVDKAGRVIVNEDLTIPGHPEVFVIGDLAAKEQHDGSFVPGVAPAAIQEGQHTAYNLDRAVAGQPLRAFRYRDKGSLATIGRAAAVANFGGRVKFGGFVAWMAWLVIHIFFLIGFRNRFLVITQWAWAYLTYQRGARLITGTDRRPSSRA